MHKEAIAKTGVNRQVKAAKVAAANARAATAAAGIDPEPAAAPEAAPEAAQELDTPATPTSTLPAAVRTEVLCNTGKKCSRPMDARARFNQRCEEADLTDNNSSY